jgi:hypothetical protein
VSAALTFSYLIVLLRIMQVRDTYGPLGQGALHLLRQSLLRFFHDKRVRVSLFLQARSHPSLPACALHDRHHQSHALHLSMVAQAA